jgi:hypothetical protein
MVSLDLLKRGNKTIKSRTLIAGYNHRQVTGFAVTLCVVFVLQLATCFAIAQQNVAVQHEPQQQIQRESDDPLENAIADSQKAAEKGRQSSLEGALPETPKMLQAREEYAVFAWQNRRDAFAWQSVATKVIFVVVIIVVFVGLYLSWMQFRIALQAPLKLTKPGTEGSTDETNPTRTADATNTIEVNTSGVKITSSVIGLVILTLSIVFFFLYLKFVYPIIEI